jgi:DNA-binding transcriptional ArsR family regulator
MNFLEKEKKDWEAVQEKKNQIGEKILSGSYQIAIYERKKLRGIDWFHMFQKALETLARNPNLKGNDFKVLMIMMSQLDWKNYIHVSQSIISLKTGIDKSNVSKSITTLVEQKIISKERVGSSCFYRLNPEFGWKGSPDELGRVVNMKEFKKRQIQYDLPF